MLVDFQIKAPGKIILHGEHAVVYNKPAIAAVIGLNTKLCCKFFPNNDLNNRIILIKLDALNSTFDIKIECFNEFLNLYRNKYGNNKNDINTIQLLEEVRVEVIKQQEALRFGENNTGSTIGANCSGVGLSSHKQQTLKAFVSIYYLLAGAVLSSPQKKMELKTGFIIHIDTELNIGAGLGSSASFGIALAAAFLLLTYHFDINSYRKPENLELVSYWGYESERVIHGTPSGVDNTICTHGGLLRFVKNQGFQPLKILHPINILLVDSKVKRSTAEIVAKVRRLSITFPNVINAIWNACEQLVAESIPLYESFGNGQDDSEKFEKLERIFQINNDLLKAIGVSHPKLEQIFSIAFKRGFFSKLTGAGAGGYVIVLLPEKYTENEVFWKLKEELEAAGFGLHLTTVGGEGLLIEKLNENHVKC